MLPNSAGDSREMDEEVAKEWEHTLLQNTMDKELHELNKRLEQKEVDILFCNKKGFLLYVMRTIGFDIFYLAVRDETFRRI